EMGSPIRVVVWAESESRASSGARAAFAEVSALDRAMSDYRPDSELSRLSDRAGLGPQAVSEPLFDVLQTAQRFATLSDGALDVPVGPVVLLWREARASRRLPDAERLRAARDLVDYRRLALDGARRTACLGKPGMRLDLGGIGKGVAADRALAA